ncbi:hypothetical protein H7X87_03670 [Acetobacteraceae bacterium]|nr:hypothetical protein [Candidatus Parcubacteria bacterium]
MNIHMKAITVVAISAAAGVLTFLGTEAMEIGRMISYGALNFHNIAWAAENAVINAQIIGVLCALGGAIWLGLSIKPKSDSNDDGHAKKTLKAPDTPPKIGSDEPLFTGKSRIMTVLAIITIAVIIGKGFSDFSWLTFAILAFGAFILVRHTASKKRGEVVHVDFRPGRKR